MIDPAIALRRVIQALEKAGDHSNLTKIWKIS